MPESLWLEVVDIMAKLLEKKKFKCMVLNYRHFTWQNGPLVFYICNTGVSAHSTVIYKNEDCKIYKTFDPHDTTTKTVDQKLNAKDSLNICSMWEPGKTTHLTHTSM